MKAETSTAGANVGQALTKDTCPICAIPRGFGGRCSSAAEFWWVKENFNDRRKMC